MILGDLPYIYCWYLIPTLNFLDIEMLEALFIIGFTTNRLISKGFTTNGFTTENAS